MVIVAPALYRWNWKQFIYFYLFIQVPSASEVIIEDEDEASTDISICRQPDQWAHCGG